LLNEQTLEHLHDLIVSYGAPEIVIPNFEDWETGEVTRRIRHTGPDVAVGNYRNVAFVTGVLIDREKAQLLETNHWDGSEMYLMARIIAGGGQLPGIDESLVRKDIRIAGEEVDSYAKKPRLKPCPIEERTPPFVQIGPGDCGCNRSLPYRQG